MVPGRTLAILFLPFATSSSGPYPLNTQVPQSSVFRYVTSKLSDRMALPTCDSPQMDVLLKLSLVGSILTNLTVPSTPCLRLCGYVNASLMLATIHPS